MRLDESIVDLRRRPVPWPGLRRAIGVGLLCAGAAGLCRAESRITVLPASGQEGRGLSASAHLRLEVKVTRVMTLQVPGPAAAWSNGGTLMLGCLGPAACVSRAAGSHGASVLSLPAGPAIIAQP